MKKIEAYIRPEKVGTVRKALDGLNLSGLTLYQVDGHGKQRGKVQKFNGEEFKVGILPKTKVEIICADSEVKGIVEAIVEAAKTGEFGDGKIVVTGVEEVIRIRTRETGEKAL
jgi:nitrogen regulatory protein P-II 1